MAVAKSYEKYPFVGDPFQEKGKMYVTIHTPKGDKKVRWYTDAERLRMDLEAEKKEKAKEEAKNDIMDFNGRFAFGFGDAGFITIYKGDEDIIKQWADENHACTRYNLTFGYYTPSHLQPVNLPSDITPVTLKWEEVQDHDDRMKPHETVKEYLSNKLFNKAPLVKGIFQGVVGKYIERDLVVAKKKDEKDMYGVKHLYTFIDAGGNSYFWKTGTLNFSVGSSCKLKMKVKEHKDIGGIPTTVVWYCKEI